MKTCVFVSTETGIEGIQDTAGVRILPDKIVFSSIEEYKSSIEMNAASFISRVKCDEQAKPEIYGADRETVFEILEDAILDEYDQFLFILSPKMNQHYKPMIDEYQQEHKDIYLVFYTATSSFYPLVHMAIEAQKLLDNGREIDEVFRMISEIDQKSVVFLFSPTRDLIHRIEKYSYDDDVLKIVGDENYIHVLRHENNTSIRLRKKNQSLMDYIDPVLQEINGKDCIPFVLYTNANSRYTEVFKSILERELSKEILLLPLSNVGVSSYGKNTCGFGYILK